MSAPAAPARAGWFGSFGGRFVPETVIAALDELETAICGKRPVAHA